MSPPTPVYSRSEVEAKYRDVLKDPSKHKCQLKSLTQHECTFRINEHDRSKAPEIICLPFKRLFQRCLVQSKKTIDGRKVFKNEWVNIEVTNQDTNMDMTKDSPFYGKDVLDFLQADKDLKRLFEMESN